MSAFSDSEHVYRVMLALWEKIKANQNMSEKLLASGLIVRFNYKDPDAVLTIDCSDRENMNVYVEACEVRPIVEMNMKSDFAHSFWLGKENVALAMLQGKITSKGPVQRALALLPCVEPAFKIYPLVWEEVA